MLAKIIKYSIFLHHRVVDMIALFALFAFGKALDANNIMCFFQFVKTQIKITMLDLNGYKYIQINTPKFFIVGLPL